MTPYLFILIPLGLYLPLFLYETYASFRRLGAPGKQGAYVHATWEVTHTFLIIGATNFIWLFSDIAVTVSKAVYWGLIIAGAGFIVRAILYVYLFFIKDAGKGNHNTPADYLFALSHIGVITGIIYAVVRAAQVLATSSYDINTQFIPWMWPGLVLLLALGALPLLQIYRTRN
jgi:hypothetical protein